MIKKEFQELIKNKLILAPLAGVADKPFRLLCKDFGADIVFSEMISVDALCYDDKKTFQMIEFEKKEEPIILQLFGDKPELFGKAIEIINEMDKNIIAIDLNSGCPVKKVVKRNAGSALMKDPALLLDIVEKMVKTSKYPVTLKIRSGWTESQANFLEIAKEAENIGISAITLHPRTRDEFFGGHSDWNKIKILKEKMNIPVIGNGDIFEFEDAYKMQEQTNCDALMIGRGALGYPWIFKDIKERKKSELSKEEVIAVMKKHLELMVKYIGEELTLLTGRKHIVWYTKGWVGGAKLRNDIFHAKSFEEIDKLFNDYLEYHL